MSGNGDWFSSAQLRALTHDAERMTTSWRLERPLTGQRKILYLYGEHELRAGAVLVLFETGEIVVTRRRRPDGSWLISRALGATRMRDAARGGWARVIGYREVAG